MRKIDLRDKKLLLAQIGLVILCFLRCCKWTKIDHAARLLIFDNYTLSLIVTFAMCVTMFVFFMLCIKKIDRDVVDKAYYFIMMITIMLYLTYAYEGYFGAMDIYGITFAVIGLMLILVDKALWLTIILMAMAVFINPMSIFTVGIVVPLLLLYKLLSTNNKKYGIYLVILSIIEIAIFFAARTMGMFRLDVQQFLDIKKFVVIMVLLIPFMIAGIRVLIEAFRLSKGGLKLYYILSIVLGVPSLIVWSVTGDYTRAIVNLFICYGIYILMMLSDNNETFLQVFNNECDRIKKWIPIKAIVIIYLAAIMLFWMSGVEEVDVEQLIELVQG